MTELNIVYWPPPLLPGTEFNSLDDMRVAWDRHGAAILENYVSLFPGSRPFACYALGLIPTPQPRHEPQPHESTTRIGDTAWRPKWCYFGSLTGPGLYYQGGTRWGEYRHLRDLGILDRDEILRAQAKGIDDRDYDPDRQYRRYEALAER